MTLLSVNLNKVALLRNSRGNDYPNVLHMAKRAVSAGAKGITVHPRPDARHATYNDVRELSAWVKTQEGIEFNVEGYPCDEFMGLVLDTLPDQCTLVPDEPNQLTSDHGWQVTQQAALLKKVLGDLKNAGIRSSIFVDPTPDVMPQAKQVGADRVELYTESFARHFERDEVAQVLEAYAQSAVCAKAQGLGINAGHDLNLNNLGALLKACAEQGAPIEEVSIGHAIMVESFDFGFEGTIKAYTEIINQLN